MAKSLLDRLEELMVKKTPKFFVFKGGNRVEKIGSSKGTIIQAAGIDPLDLTPEEFQEYRDIEISDIIERFSSPQSDGSEFGRQYDEIEYYMNADTDKYFLVSSKTKRPIRGGFETWRSIIKDRELIDAKYRGAAIVEYNPTVMDSVRDFEEDNNPLLDSCTIFNTYSPPKWKVLRAKGEVGSLDPRIEEFFEHFIPDDGCREYVFERMMMIVDGKLPVILVMNSLTGTGKGLFVENILMHGVGKGNFSNSPISWDRSGFNAWLSETQIAWMDEAKVNPDGNQANTNLLKRLVNDYQAIEKKGVDVRGSTKVWASIIITNNQGTKNFRLEEDNRRFSVLDVAQAKMRDALGEEEEERIARAIVENEDNILDEFWLWLSANYSTRNYGGPYTLWKGAQYEKFLYESRNRWQRVMIDMCRSGEYISFSKEDFMTKCDEEFEEGVSQPRTSSVESFLSEFTLVGGTYLGKAEIQKRGWKVVVNKELVSESVLIGKEKGMVEVIPEKVYEDNTMDRIKAVEIDMDAEDL